MGSNEKILTMQETCILCDKKQKTNEIFYRYEDLGFSLCDECDSLGEKEINRRWKVKQNTNAAADEVERDLSNKPNHRKKPRKEECVCGGEMTNHNGNWFCEFERGLK